jgi:hypothetical protein
VLDLLLGDLRCSGCPAHRSISMRNYKEQLGIILVGEVH